MSSCEKFTSTSGAIAACVKPFFHQPLSSFQSHNGAIAARSGECRYSERLPNLNPTMVRLLPGDPTERKRLINSFNPTVVRLLRLIDMR